jgi:hypothetical protein
MSVSLIFRCVTGSRFALSQAVTISAQAKAEENSFTPCIAITMLFVILLKNMPERKASAFAYPTKQVLTKLNFFPHSFHCCE